MKGTKESKRQGVCLLSSYIRAPGGASRSTLGIVARERVEAGAQVNYSSGGKR